MRTVILYTNWRDVQVGQENLKFLCQQSRSVWTFSSPQNSGKGECFDEDLATHSSLPLWTRLPRWHLSSAAQRRGETWRMWGPGLLITMTDHTLSHTKLQLSLHALVQLLRDHIIQSKLYRKVGRPFITLFIFDNDGTEVRGFALYQICSGKRRKISGDKISCQICL